MSGLWDTRAPGRRIDRAFLGLLVSGPNPLGVPEQRVGRSFLGQLVFGPFPFEALGSGRLARGDGPGPKVPTMPPFSCRGGRSSPVRKNNKVDHHIMGNSLPLMLLNFQRKFYNFFSTALDVIGSSGSILRYRSSYKRRG